MEKDYVMDTLQDDLYQCVSEIEGFFDVLGSAQHDEETVDTIASIGKILVNEAYRRLDEVYVNLNKFLGNVHILRPKRRTIADVPRNIEGIRFQSSDILNRVLADQEAKGCLSFQAIKKEGNRPSTEDGKAVDFVDDFSVIVEAENMKKGPLSSLGRKSDKGPETGSSRSES